MNLSKSPASTIQILGAEKALFRALKTKHDTPKYGLIYHASLIGQASGRNKGKMARVLAAKAALGIRVDALHEWDEEEEVTEEEKAVLGTDARSHLERKLSAWEGKPLKPKGVAIAPNGVPATTQPKKWEIKEARKYNPDADGLAGDEAPAVKPKGKKAKKLIEEMDVKMEDGEVSEESESQPDEPIDSDEAAAIDPPKTNGVSKSDEKKRRKEEKLLRKQGRKEKRAEKAGSVDEKTAALAAKAGLSVERYNRKLERGEIKFEEDGTPVSISKKDIKKSKKGAEKAAANGEVDGSKKRKRVEDEQEQSKSEKKKKRKEKAS